MDLRNKIRSFVASVSSSAATDIDNDDALLDTGVIDSVAMIELVVWVEEEFGFSIEIDELTQDNFGTIDRLAKFIESHDSESAKR
ncbi:MAG: acyl carrier protein [Planctomycetota bacterium]